MRHNETKTRDKNINRCKCSRVLLGFEERQIDENAFKPLLTSCERVYKVHDWVFRYV